MKDKSSKGKTSIYPWIFLVLGMLLYANTINHDYAWDDSIVIENNPHTQQGLAALGDIWTKPTYIVERPIYRPVTQTTFALEQTLYPEDNPSLGHGINIVLYGLCCMLVFVFLRNLLFNYHIFFSFFSTLLFTVHPIHTEVVANIKSRDEILALLFSLLSLILFKKFVENRNVKNLIAPILLLLTAVLSKGNAITILAIYPLVYYFQKNNITKTKSNYQINLQKNDFKEVLSSLAGLFDKSWFFKAVVFILLIAAVLFHSQILAGLGIATSALYLFLKVDTEEAQEGSNYFLWGSFGIFFFSLFFGLKITMFIAVVFCLLYPVITRNWDKKTIVLSVIMSLLSLAYSGDFEYFIVPFIVLLFSYLQYRNNKKHDLSYLIPAGFLIMSVVIGKLDMALVFLVNILIPYLRWFTKTKHILIGSLLLICTIGASELYLSSVNKSISSDIAMYRYNSQVESEVLEEETINWGEETLELSPLNNTISEITNNNERHATIAYVNLLYLGKSFYPNPLVHNYGINTIAKQSFKNVAPWLSFLIYGLLILYSLICLKKRDPISFGVLWFIITLSIYSHIVKLAPDTLAERFLFFPSLGFSVSFIFALSAILKNDFNQGLFSTTRNALFSIILFGLSGLAIVHTFNRNKDWKDNFTLTSETLPNVPNSSLLQINYSTELYKYHTDIKPSNNPADFIPAIQAAEKAIEIHPEFFYAMMHLSEMYLETGEIDKAKKILNRALEVNPKHVAPSFKLGLVYYSTKEYQKGVDVMQSSLDFYGDNLSKALSYSEIDEFYLFLGRCYFNAGNMEKAIAIMEEATAKQPDNPHYYDLLSSMFIRIGNKEGALSYLEKANIINPNNSNIENKLNNLRQEMSNQ